MYWSHTNHPRARREHRCTMCGRTIRVGEVYMRGSGFGEGTAYTWRECAHCEALLPFVRSLWDDDEYSMDTITEWEPDTVAEWRVKAMHRRRWQRLDGGLHPVPVVEFTEVTYPSGYVAKRPVTVRPGVSETHVSEEAHR